MHLYNNVLQNAVKCKLNWQPWVQLVAFCDQVASVTYSLSTFDSAMRLMISNMTEAATIEVMLLG